MDPLSEAIRKRGTDAYVVYANSRDADMRYLTHFTTSDPFVYFRKQGEEGTIIISQMEVGRATREGTNAVMTRAEAGLPEIIKKEKDPYRATAQMIAGQVGKKILVPPNFPIALANALREFCSVTVDKGTVLAMRAKKTRPEIRCMKIVQSVTQIAMGHAASLLKNAVVKKGILYLDGKLLTSERIKYTMHCVLLEYGRLTVAPHWVPTFEEPASRPDFARLADTFRQTLRTAVERQLDGGLPACFLSGGTDSSTVAGMISAVAGRQAHTFSIGFEAEGYDEMAFARIASGHFKTQHHEYYVTPDDLVRSIPAVAQHYDQPFGNSSALPAYYCAKMAREAGATRVLAGDGGDELFGGNTRYAKQRVFGIYGQLPAALRSLVLQPLLQGSPLGRLPLLRKGRSYIEQARVPMPDRMQTYNLLERLGIREVLGDGILGHADPEAPHRLQREVWALARTNDEVNRMLAFDWRFTLADCDLPKVSGTTALAGIEVGFPMLDGDLVDFSCALPVNYKLKRLALRWFFKEALRGFLPDEVITKKKQGFGLPFGVWATRHDGLKALAVDSLHSLGARGVVRPAFVQALVNDRLPEHPGYYGEMIWILMMLEQWLRKYAPDQRF